MALKEVQRKNPDGTISHADAASGSQGTTLSQMQSADTAVANTTTQTADIRLTGTGTTWNWKFTPNVRRD